MKSRLALWAGLEDFMVDEHPRATTSESLAKLPTVFKKDGTITAANASVSRDSACPS